MAVSDIRASRRSSAVPSGGITQPLRSNEKDELLVAQGLPPYAEVTRKGQSWSVMSVLAVAALVVRPSGTAALEIWNGYAAGGPSLIIDRIFSQWLVSTAVAQGAIQWAAVTASKAAPAAGANVTTRGNSGKAYGGSVVAGLGTTVTDSGWFPWGQPALGLGAATPLGGLMAEVNGRLIVPPQCSLALHVTASVVGDTFTQGASWFEETLTNEV